MEIESRDGSRTLFKMGSVIEFGRGSGFKTDDRTVSRCHVSFRVHPVEKSMVEFKVIGKNPVWVHSCKSRQVSTFRTSESGEMEIGDMFCVSAKNPTWFALKKAEFEAETENTVKSELDFKSQSEESLDNRFQIKDVVGPLDPESIDISNIDPIKEFGFLVIGKEFHSYPNKLIRGMKNWNWFIEDPRVDNEENDDDDEELEEKKKKRRKRKNRREENEEDEEWTGESEEEKEQLTNTRKVKRPNKYVTRSRDRHEISTVSNVNVKKLDDEDKEEEEEDEDDDETLGGFIVDDDDSVEEESKEIDDVDEEEEDKDDEFHA